MNLKALLARLSKGEKLNAKEVAFLVANDDATTPEQKALLANMRGDEEIAEEELKSVISKHTSEAVEKQVGEAAEMLVKKFSDRFQAAHEKKEPITEAKTASNKKTLEFMKAVFAEDRDKLKALTTSDADSPKAGYLIPADLQREVLRIVQDQYGLARKLMRYLPFTGPGNTRMIPKIGTNPTVYWTDEKAAKQSSQPTFGLVEQILKKLAVIIPWTDELMEDSGIDLTQLFGELIAEAFAKAEDLAFLAGTGTPFLGVLNDPATNKVTMGSGETFSDVNADDLLALQYAVPAGYEVNARYIMNRTVFAKIRGLKDSQNRYIYGEPSAAAPATIWGKPFELSDAMPAITATAANKPFVFFGDLKRTAIIGDKQQIRVKLLDQATINDTDNETILNLAQQDMSAMRFVERVGYVFTLPEATAVLKTE